MSNRLHYLLIFLGLLSSNACQTASKQDPPQVLAHVTPTDGGLGEKTEVVDAGQQAPEIALPETSFQSKACATTYNVPTAFSTLPGTLLLENLGYPFGA